MSGLSRRSQFVPVSDDAFTCWQTSCGARQEEGREHDMLSYHRSQWMTICPVECVFDLLSVGEKRRLSY